MTSILNGSELCRRLGTDRRKQRIHLRVDFCVQRPSLSHMCGMFLLRNFHLYDANSMFVHKML